MGFGLGNFSAVLSALPPPCELHPQAASLMVVVGLSSSSLLIYFSPFVTGPPEVMCTPWSQSL